VQSPIVNFNLFKANSTLRTVLKRSGLIKTVVTGQVKQRDRKKETSKRRKRNRVKNETFTKKKKKVRHRNVQKGSVGIKREKSYKDSRERETQTERCYVR